MNSRSNFGGRRWPWTANYAERYEDRTPGMFPGGYDGEPAPRATDVLATLPDSPRQLEAKLTQMQRNGIRVEYVYGDMPEHAIPARDKTADYASGYTAAMKAVGEVVNAAEREALRRMQQFHPLHDAAERVAESRALDVIRRIRGRILTIRST